MSNIQSLRVQDFKGVRNIELTPRGSLVVIAGGNGEGKSSFIDAFAELIDPKGVKLTSKPIREGAERAVAELVTDDFIATRTWLKNNDPGKLVVKAPDGAVYPSAADFMRKVTGAGLFDPIAFVNLPEKDQRQQLLARVDLPFDLDELERQRKGAYDARTDVNREVTRLEGQLAGFAEPDPDLPDHELSAATLLAEAEAMRLRNADIDANIRHAEALQSAREKAERAVVAAEDALEAARDALRGAQKEELDHLAFIQALPDREDVATITDKLVDVEAINSRIRAREHRAAIAAELDDRRAAAVEHTSFIDEIETQKREALAAAKFPVAGLSVDEQGVTFEGIPFRQVNTARQRAIAFDLITAGEPRLRLAQIKDGDLLDGDTLAEIRRIADERGFTVLIERDRDESRDIGFVIDDGALAS